VGGATRLGSDRAILIVFVLTLVVFGAAYLRDLSLPGLYMDAVNPEYLIPGIVDPPPPLDYAVPGNRLGGRFPVFTGTYYHGSTQLYAALPFLSVFGTSLTTFRLFQMAVGAGILALILWMSASRTFGPKRALAAGAAGLLAVDPAFVLSLRTQAYSCMFPLLLLLGCVLLLPGWRDSRRPYLRLVVAGVLFGLSVFSYFIFAFFLPALLWLVLRRPADDASRRPWTMLLPWLAGCAVGYLPFVVGMLLIRDELGGTSQLLDWLQATRDQLKPGQDKEGLVSRIDTVQTESRRVFTGEWPWLMILGQHRTGLIESLKADVLVLVPLMALAVPRLTAAAQRRAIRPVLALAVSFGCGALVFGSRLDGHHYTAALPLLYAAFGCACAALWPWESGARWRSLLASRLNAARAALVVVSMALIAVTSVHAQEDFHRGLQSTGGVRLYSKSIDEFARAVDRTAPDATLYTPDWGFSMPLAFLSEATPVRPIVDAAEIRQEVCAGKPQFVVFAGSGNEAKVRIVADLARRPIDELVTWSQRDGVPVFQVARFAPGTRCGAATAGPDGATTATDGPRAATIAITPESIPACAFLAQAAVAQVSWTSGTRRRRDIEVYTQSVGGPEALWVRGAAPGHGETGPWAAPGVRFILRDASTKEQLASATVGQSPCPAT